MKSPAELLQVIEELRGYDHAFINANGVDKFAEDFGVHLVPVASNHPVEDEWPSVLWPSARLRELIQFLQEVETERRQKEAEQK